MGAEQDAIRWQAGVWDRMSDIYRREIDSRFAAVVRGCITRCGLRTGESVLDLGTGTGAAATAAAAIVGPTGSVTAVDLSTEMLAVARQRIAGARLTNVEVREGRAEDIPAADASFDVVVASLSFMYVIDRQRGARECARVLRPGGRFVAAVWGGPDDADIVRFQQLAGQFAPPPPVAGVGPGSLADGEPFLTQLHDVGIAADVESEVIEFGFETLQHAWHVLAGVTTANLDEELRREARSAVQAAMWPDPSAPRAFKNLTQFIVGRRT